MNKLSFISFQMSSTRKSPKKRPKRNQEELDDKQLSCITWLENNYESAKEASIEQQTLRKQYLEEFEKESQISMDLFTECVRYFFLLLVFIIILIYLSRELYFLKLEI